LVMCLFLPILGSGDLERLSEVVVATLSDRLNYLLSPEVCSRIVDDGHTVSCFV